MTTIPPLGPPSEEQGMADKAERIAWEHAVRAEAAYQTLATDPGWHPQERCDMEQVLARMWAAIARVSLGAESTRLAREVDAKDAGPEYAGSREGLRVRQTLRSDDGTYHDEETLRKVWAELYKTGLDEQCITDVITGMQNSGILFRERF